MYPSLTSVEGGGGGGQVQQKEMNEANRNTEKTLNGTKSISNEKQKIPNKQEK